MMLMLDLMAQRYGVLPSQVLKFGDTVDMITAITSLEYEAWKQKKQSKGHTPTHHSQDELQARIQSVRAMNHGNSKTEQDTGKA
jgi:hypothetical protein